ncbi:hypothetical protein ACWIGC_24070, partial [Streptomyces diastaticus]
MADSVGSVAASPGRGSSEDRSTGGASSCAGRAWCQGASELPARAGRLPETGGRCCEAEPSAAERLRRGRAAAGRPGVSGDGSAGAPGASGLSDPLDWGSEGSGAAVGPEVRSGGGTASDGAGAPADFPDSGGPAACCGAEPCDADRSRRGRAGAWACPSTAD